MRRPPAAEGYRRPAEWTPPRATWTAWPTHPEWGPHLTDARAAVAQMCRALAEGERVEVLVNGEAAEADAQRAIDAANVRFHRVPYGDIWLRDIGPLFVTGPAGTAAVCCGFNGWGGRYLFPDDLGVAAQVAAIAGAPRYTFDWILEGGAVDVDGEGTALTTRQCVLNPNRGGPDEATVEARLADALGVTRTLWLDDGLANDHTDGHVDTLARFVAPGVVVCMAPAGPADPNRDALRAVTNALSGARDAAGRAIDVITLPGPGRVEVGGELLPASYVNFYLGARAIIVPTYGVAADAEAVSTLAALFPDRATVPIDARAVLTGGGAFHCITQQEPR